MTVYTRRRQATVWALPWWLAVFVLPFWVMGLLLWGLCALFVGLIVGSVRIVGWAIRTCASLRFPRGVDSGGDE